ncbi:hypothetical protein [Achromobacter sp. Root565]|uniref:hypothetical protein n=1 Tax=Achromobacter sp. Root565 TaxID=1736564 RepID=UPI0006FC3C0B|nr:hypothetical protein [Achromobacter sp. Root565]KQZ96657.1 hypothetical protein ASD71_24480 [Achromobacter sp. Root565]
MRSSVLFVAALVTGCAAPAPGDMITQSKVQAIKINVTTFDEMVRDFGPPRTRDINKQGLRTASWFYFNNSEFGAMQDQRTLTVTYNKDGTVKEYLNASAGERDGAQKAR